jgi:uncharacterized membrane protein HdeD (DUF308 family)
VKKALFHPGFLPFHVGKGPVVLTLFSERTRRSETMRTTLARFGQATLLRTVIAVLFLRGCLALVFGIAAFFWPSLTVETLGTLFAIWVLLDGIVSLALALADLTQRVHWWGHLGEGVLGLIVGLVTFFRSPITSLGLLYLIVIWALVLGMLEIFIAFWTRPIARESWLTFLTGVFSLLFGLVLLVQPATGAMASVRVIVLYAMIVGTMQVTRAVRIGQTAIPAVAA